MEEIVARVVDGSDFESYKSEYGKTVLCGNARIGGYAVGIVANQRTMVTSGAGEMQMGVSSTVILLTRQQDLS